MGTTQNLRKGPELLKRFLRRNKISLRQAGKALGVEHVAVKQWCDAVCTPKYHRHAIEVWTRGEVSEGSWGVEQKEPANIQPYTPESHA